MWGCVMMTLRRGSDAPASVTHSAALVGMVERQQQQLIEMAGRIGFSQAQLVDDRAQICVAEWTD